MNKEQETMRSQERLFEIEKLATIGMVARGVAHDMNNKLAAIMTTVQMELQYRKDADPELQESLKLIHEATTQCRELIQNLFKYSSRVSNVKSNEVIDFKDVIDCVGSLLKYRLDEWGIKIETDFKMSTPFRAYPDECIHLFMHLILNAADAIRKKGSGGKIQIRTKENEACFIFEIEDDGEGIPEELISKAFEPHGATSESISGLDLSIVQQIVSKYKGEIKMKSATGKGSEVSILLPKKRNSNEMIS